MGGGPDSPSRKVGVAFEGASYLVKFQRGENFVKLLELCRGQPVGEEQSVIYSKNVADWNLLAFLKNSDKTFLKGLAKSFLEASKQRDSIVPAARSVVPSGAEEVQDDEVEEDEELRTGVAARPRPSAGDAAAEVGLEEVPAGRPPAAAAGSLGVDVPPLEIPDLGDTDRPRQQRLSLGDLSPLAGEALVASPGGEEASLGMSLGMSLASATTLRSQRRLAAADDAVYREGRVVRNELVPVRRDAARQQASPRARKAVAFFDGGAAAEEVGECPPERARGGVPSHVVPARPPPKWKAEEAAAAASPVPTDQVLLPGGLARPPWGSSLSPSPPAKGRGGPGLRRAATAPNMSVPGGGGGAAAGEGAELSPRLRRAHTLHRMKGGGGGGGGGGDGGGAAAAAARRPAGPKLIQHDLPMQPAQAATKRPSLEQRSQDILNALENVKDPYAVYKQALGDRRKEGTARTKEKPAAAAAASTNSFASYRVKMSARLKNPAGGGGDGDAPAAEAAAEGELGGAAGGGGGELPSPGVSLEDYLGYMEAKARPPPPAPPAAAAAATPRLTVRERQLRAKAREQSAPLAGPAGGVLLPSPGATWMTKRPTPPAGRAPAPGSPGGWSGGGGGRLSPRSQLGARSVASGGGGGGGGNQEEGGPGRPGAGGGASTQPLPRDLDALAHKPRPHAHTAAPLPPAGWEPAGFRPRRHRQQKYFSLASEQPLEQERRLKLQEQLSRSTLFHPARRAAGGGGAGGAGGEEGGSLPAIAAKPSFLAEDTVYTQAAAYEAKVQRSLRILMHPQPVRVAEASGFQGGGRGGRRRRKNVQKAYKRRVNTAEYSRPLPWNRGYARLLQETAMEGHYSPQHAARQRAAAVDENYPEDLPAGSTRSAAGAAASRRGRAGGGGGGGGPLASESAPVFFMPAAPGSPALRSILDSWTASGPASPADDGTLGELSALTLPDGAEGGGGPAWGSSSAEEEPQEDEEEGGAVVWGASAAAEGEEGQSLASARSLFKGTKLRGDRRAQAMARELAALSAQSQTEGSLLRSTYLLRKREVETGRAPPLGFDGPAPPTADGSVGGGGGALPELVSLLNDRAELSVGHVRVDWKGRELHSMAAVEAVRREVLYPAITGTDFNALQKAGRAAAEQLKLVGDELAWPAADREAFVRARSAWGTVDYAEAVARLGELLGAHADLAAALRLVEAREAALAALERARAGGGGGGGGGVEGEEEEEARLGELTAALRARLPGLRRRLYWLRDGVVWGGEDVQRALERFCGPPAAGEGGEGEEEEGPAPWGGGGGGADVLVVHG